MARPKKQVKRKSSGVSFGSAWLWFFSGLLSGLVLTTIALQQGWIKLPSSLMVEQNPTVIDGNSNVATPDEDLAPPPQEFDFFEILKEPAAPIDREQLKREAEQQREQQKAATTPEQPAVSGNAPEYILQIASFRSPTDADQLKAELGLMGIGANISTAEVNGASWYRVRVGPVKDAGEVDRMHQILQEAGYKIQIYRQ